MAALRPRRPMTMVLAPRATASLTISSATSKCPGMNLLCTVVRPGGLEMVFGLGHQPLPLFLLVFLPAGHQTLAGLPLRLIQNVAVVPECRRQTRQNMEQGDIQARGLGKGLGHVFHGMPGPIRPIQGDEQLFSHMFPLSPFYLKNNHPPGEVKSTLPPSGENALPDRVFVLRILSTG